MAILAAFVVLAPGVLTWLLRPSLTALVPSGALAGLGIYALLSIPPPKGESYGGVVYVIFGASLIAYAIVLAIAATVSFVRARSSSRARSRPSS